KRDMSPKQRDMIGSGWHQPPRPKQAIVSTERRAGQRPRPDFKFHHTSHSLLRPPGCVPPMADNIDTTTSGSPELLTYDPKPSLQYASQIGLYSAGVGLFASTIQNALSSHSSGAMGFLTRSGGTIGFFAAMGATFAFTEAVVANQREKDDALNGAAGGCAAGFLAGIRARSIPVAIASCAVLGAAVGTFDYGGKRLIGEPARETQEERRKRFFKHPPPPPLAPSPAVAESN
ncbi:NADH-ubiquinone oxidoreductase 21 subunit, partial [Grifola frondosa]